MAPSGIGEVDPEAAWAALRSERKAMLIDVRTRAEWSFVGLPDLSEAGAEVALIEWQSFPAMTMNPDFTASALAAIEAAGAEEVYFICRSGVRSMRAALATAEAAGSAGWPLACFNVAEGFEGELDPTARRGVLNGWKARGLPWRQS
ncbi:rhodanese-like domain-containing protein [Pikeienuella piscinae]|uniref:Rhodanese-like domain-containing protein n=1 Tax=Pikeienuella piscinae TaxID=2748098 RepID=A0A7L5BVK6_9RHOB|nr:rhodanese-like domain-containing protein [Pikeienuella piscinae]QIE55885.1 rhodanese-like domain-containing protein [Pikeienuella piscinae]